MHLIKTFRKILILKKLKIMISNMPKSYIFITDKHLTIVNPYDKMSRYNWHVGSFL